MTQIQRPLSPHLQIYKPQITSVLSIFHRLTGVFLSLGSVVLVVWLVSLGAYAHDPAFYTCVHDFFANPLGQLLLMGWTFSFFYHMANGIRHLVWDAGCGYDLKTVTMTGWAVLLFAGGAPALTWVYLLIR